MQNTVKLVNNSAKLILAAFVLFTVISYFFSLYTGYYNGDYLGAMSSLSKIELFFNLIISIAPFFILYIIYKYFSKWTGKYKIRLPGNIFVFFLLFLIIFNIIVTNMFGVGRAGQELYKAPPLIKIFIQIFSRFNALMGIFIYDLGVKKRSRIIIFLLYLLVIASSLSAYSIGIFAYLGFFVIIKYYTSLFRFIKKNIYLLIFMIMLFPIITGSLYNFRERLRNHGQVTGFQTSNASKIVFGVLVGRLSSFSNSAIIMERKNKIISLSKEFSAIQYIKETITAVYGGFVNREETRYASILLESQGFYTTRAISFMLGTQGVLLLGIYQSFIVLIINFTTIFVMVILNFKLISMINCANIKELLFLYYCFCIMSGMGNEFLSNLVTVVLYILLFMILNFIGQYGRR
jgi:hypothetical protein